MNKHLVHILDPRWAARHIYLKNISFFIENHISFLCTCDFFFSHFEEIQMMAALQLIPDNCSPFVIQKRSEYNALFSFSYVNKLCGFICILQYAYKKYGSYYYAINVFYDMRSLLHNTSRLFVYFRDSAVIVPKSFPVICKVCKLSALATSSMLPYRWIRDRKGRESN